MKTLRGGFTLFELILAIALSAALLALVGAAINLYLTRVDTSRARVEEAQLARSILAMIADDLRATAIYQPQDTSAIAQLMANGTPFDVDSIDDERAEGSGSESTGGSASAFGGGSASLGSISSGAGTSGASSSGSSSSSSSSSSSAEEDSTMPLGLNGTLNQLYVDVTRLPGREELFNTITGYTNAPLPKAIGFGASASVVSAGAGAMPPSDVKTIRYFIRQGEQVPKAGVAATSLAPGLQSVAGGLVRQEIARPLRLFAEESGDTNVLESGQALIAPEVVYIEFRYFSGQQTTDVWDMVETESLPRAVEVTIWLRSSDPNETESAPSYSLTDLARTSRAYRETVYLPMSELMESSSGASSSDSSSSSESSGSSSGFGSSSNDNSGFGEQ